MEWTHATGTANPRSTAHTARLLAAAVAVACSAAAWVVGHRAIAGARSAWGAPEPLEPLGWLLQAALAVVAAWLAAGFALEALAGMPGRLGRTVRSLRDRLGPWGGSAVVSLFLGVLTSPTAATAQDTPDPLDLSSLATASAPAAPGGSTEGATPAAEATPAQKTTPAPDTGSGAEPPPERPDTVTVAPGDTLWDIAARSLGPQASAPAVDAEWRHWYAANREVIGPDPHLLLPGTRLAAPTTGAEEAR
ncbi:LysM peptidoglycan-binding domain-containing protein [Kytococcus sedentarius]|uniref:LysM peptidoglycan-binding domain-containing protein n=1 Tax=Kytococcus sedentarius TaxID=1276 RepID=UPI0035BC2B06